VDAPHRPGLVVATLTVSVVLLAAGLLAVLSQSAVRRTGMNRVRVTTQLGALQSGQTVCQRKELIPAGTGAIRASLLAGAEGGGGVRVAVIAAGGGTVAGGARAAGWSGGTLTVPLRPIVARETPARVCLTATGSGLFELAGETAENGRGRASVGGSALGGDLRFVYLRPRPESWWSAAGGVIDRMDVGHPLGGRAIAVLVGLLSIAAVALASWQLARSDP